MHSTRPTLFCERLRGPEPGDFLVNAADQASGLRWHVLIEDCGQGWRERAPVDEMEVAKGERAKSLLRGVEIRGGCFRAGRNLPISVTEIAHGQGDASELQPRQWHCVGADETTAQMKSALDGLSGRGGYSVRPQRPVVGSLAQACQ